MRSSSLVLLHVCLCLCSASRPSILSRQALSPDPCGPLVQGQVGQPLNTCNGTKIPEEAVPAPAIYATYLDANVQVASYPAASSGWVESCMTSIDYLCTGLDADQRGAWTTQSDGISCTASVYLPGDNAAETPTTYHCMYDVLFPMLKLLSEGKGVNRASINIAEDGFPSGFRTGTQIDSGYASWSIQLCVPRFVLSSQGKLIDNKTARIMLEDVCSHNLGPVLFLDTFIRQLLKHPSYLRRLTRVAWSSYRP